MIDEMRALIFWIALIAGLTIITCVGITECQKTNRLAFEKGLVRQYNSNVSGWVK